MNLFPFYPAARAMVRGEEKTLPRDILVALGSHQLNDRFEIGKITCAVSRIRIHPEYKKEDSNHANIAVIILDQEININTYKPINFMDISYEVMSVPNVFHVSFGNRETLNPESVITLKELRSSTLENQDCLASINDQSFCIGEDKESIICIDDIGSGVFVSHNGEYYLRGIVSEVRGSPDGLCSNTAYSLITDISRVSEWIKEAPIADDLELEDRFER